MGAQIAVTLVVGEDEEDVRPALGRGKTKKGEQ